MAKPYILIMLMCFSSIAQAATTLTKYKLTESETTYIVTAILKKNGNDRDIKFMNALVQARSEAEAIGLSFARARGEYSNYSVVETIATELEYSKSESNQEYSEFIQ
jgi:hypothetical protein